MGAKLDCERKGVVRVVVFTEFTLHCFVSSESGPELLFFRKLGWESK